MRGSFVVSEFAIFGGTANLYPSKCMRSVQAGLRVVEISSTLFVFSTGFPLGVSFATYRR